MNFRFTIKSENFSLPTGCAKANLDTLNASCDKDFDFLIISITILYLEEWKFNSKPLFFKQINSKTSFNNGGKPEICF